jgi:phage gp36-like protein
MKTDDAITILDHFACALLPIALQMNNGNMKDAVKDSYEVALEVLRQRANFHAQALEESGNRAEQIDAAVFNERVVRGRGESPFGEQNRPEQ